MENFWQTNIKFLKKVGPKRADALRLECKILSYEDLLHYFPRKHVDKSKVLSIRRIKQELPTLVTLIGKIRNMEVIKGKKGRGRFVMEVIDETDELTLTWFQGYTWIRDTFRLGDEVILFGRPAMFGSELQIRHPEIELLKDEESASQLLRIIPMYPSTEKMKRMGLDSKGMRKIMEILLQWGKDKIYENLSPHMVKRYKLMPRNEALYNLHFPASFQLLSQAIRRLKFEELFFFQLLLANRRKRTKAQNLSNAFPSIGHYFNTYYHNHLPFSLTNAQKRVLREIRKDLAQPYQMNRLVQGDVGSGKTIVAFMTMLMAKDNGFQSALMAPTEILAEQHYRKLSKYAEPLGLKVSLLVGGQRKKLRTEILESLADGSTDIAVGTHALIVDNVKFKRLGLTVVDEQHKFGVLQRAKLWQKAKPFPHNMVMTATPIPRTLAMTLYGDIDVSVINELPPGRKPIRTYWFGESKRLEVLGFIRRELEKGRQAYVVYPLVEESSKLDLLAATQGYEELQNYFKSYRIGIVHGKMASDVKEFEMQRFVKHETHVLVSTTVIEVGVDVPNSSIMLIENAERFGLSQLHQLRGRVGRGKNQSYCLLMAGTKVSREGKARLQAMVDTTDGFKLSEIDLKLRGPGDFLGTRQSGLPEFQLANIAEDQDILQEARKAAFALVKADPELEKPEHQAIRSFFERYQKRNQALASMA